MADNEIQVAEAVGNNSVMACAAVDLSGSIHLFEFVTEAPELMWLDNLVGRSLHAREDCGVFRDLDVENECFESVSRRAGVDEREKFTDDVAVGYDINRADVERRICEVQGAEEGFKRTVWMAGCVLGDVDETGVFL